MFKRKLDNVVHKCAVRLLDDENVLEYDILESYKGKFLLDQLCQHLEVKEADYFGLRYVDSGKQRQWLDLEKLITKQCKDVQPLVFSFRIKFYPADPFHLSRNVRILLYKQLKRDLMHGRLYCSNDEIIALGALIVQEELGDYNPNFPTDDYVFNLELPIRQADSIEKKIVNKHMRRTPGQNPMVAVDEFLRIVRSLETYGVEPHNVKDQQGCQMYIGINFSGINAFVAGKRSQHIRWSEIRKLNFEGRMFIVHTAHTDASREVKKQAYGFKCTSGAACRYLWRCAIEHMLFFTLPNCHNTSVKYGGGIFSRGAKFKYTGRTEREIFNDIIYASNYQLEGNDAENGKKSSSVPVTPSSPKGDLFYIRYNSLPRSEMYKPDEYNFDRHKSTIEHANLMEIQNGYNMPQTQTSFVKNINSNEDSYIDNHYSRATHHNNVCIGDNMGPAAAAAACVAPITHISGNEEKSGADIGQDWCSKKIRHAKNPRKFHIIRSFLPSLAFVILTVILSASFIFESSTELFDCIRNAPEMIILKDEYYVPFKKFIQDMVLM